MGKSVEYSATKGNESNNTGRSVCLVNVKYRGKAIADHIWVNNTEALQRFKYGDDLHFFATAKTYKDNKENRKLGLRHCHKYHRKHPGVDQYNHDKEQAQIRHR